MSIPFTYKGSMVMAINHAIAVLHNELDFEEGWALLLL